MRQPYLSRAAQIASALALARKTDDARSAQERDAKHAALKEKERRHYLSVSTQIKEAVIKQVTTEFEARESKSEDERYRLRLLENASTRAQLRKQDLTFERKEFLNALLSFRLTKDKETRAERVVRTEEQFQHAAILELNFKGSMPAQNLREKGRR